MRAQRFRPVFDRLDTRLVFDGSGIDAMGGGNVGSSVLPLVTSCGQNLIDIVDWYLPGTPPDDPYDPAQIPIAWDEMPAN